jgi:hypothetical protein
VLPEISINDILQLKKPHPCGSYEWKVVRLGADIGLICCKCDRKVLLSRRELSKRLKKIQHLEDNNRSENE